MTYNINYCSTLELLKFSNIRIEEVERYGSAINSYMVRLYLKLSPHQPSYYITDLFKLQYNARSISFTVPKSRNSFTSLSIRSLIDVKLISYKKIIKHFIYHFIDTTFCNYNAHRFVLPNNWEEVKVCPIDKDTGFLSQESHKHFTFDRAYQAYYYNKIKFVFTMDDRLKFEERHIKMLVQHRQRFYRDIVNRLLYLGTYEELQNAKQFKIIKKHVEATRDSQNNLGNAILSTIN